MILYLCMMDKFSTYFGLTLSFLIFSATEQLSVTLQGQNTTIQEAAASVNLTIKSLEHQRKDELFDHFYSKPLEESKDLTSDPVVPQYKWQPRFLDEGPVRLIDLKIPGPTLVVAL